MKKQITGTYVAKKDTEIKYIYSLGGGVKGRTVKAGEEVTAICVMNDINAQSVATKETLYRIELNSFLSTFDKKSLVTPQDDHPLNQYFID